MIGVVGCGLMGAGIAEVVARAGKAVTVVESSKGAVRAGQLLGRKSGRGFYTYEPASAKRAGNLP